MAKITDLVKTYRMLSDPNAPDWNVKFVGAVAIAAIVVSGGAGALLWSLSSEDTRAPPATSVQEPTDGPEEPCAIADDAPAPPTLPPECVADVLP